MVRRSKRSSGRRTKRRSLRSTRSRRHQRVRHTRRRGSSKRVGGTLGSTLGREPFEPMPNAVKQQMYNAKNHSQYMKDSGNAAYHENTYP